MHPWTKPSRDVYSPDELQRLNDLEKEMKHAVFQEVLGQLLSNINLADVLKDIALDGFETVSDYEKYGNCFIPVQLKSGYKKI